MAFEDNAARENEASNFIRRFQEAFDALELAHHVVVPRSTFYCIASPILGGHLWYSLLWSHSVVRCWLWDRSRPNPMGLLVRSASSPLQGLQHMPLACMISLLAEKRCNMQGVASSAIIGGHWTANFLVGLSFPIMLKLFGIGGSYGIYALLNFATLGMLFSRVQFSLQLHK